MTQSEINRIADTLIERLQRQGLIPTTPDEPFLTTDEAAEHLNMSVKTLYHKIAEVPHVKRGKRLYFTRSSLNRYINGE